MVRRKWEPTMKRAMQMLKSSVLVALAPLASPQEEQDPAALKIAAGFVNFAGSEDNILALAWALREGVVVRLMSATAPDSPALPEVVTIRPPSGPMSWNDVKMAL